MMGPQTFDAFLAVAMMAVFALAGGSFVLLRRPGERRRGALMLAAAAVLFANVLIWTL